MSTRRTPTVAEIRVAYANRSQELRARIDRIRATTPPWAPSELIEVAARSAELSEVGQPRAEALKVSVANRKQEQRVALALITDERMENVWACLRKRADSYTPPPRRGPVRLKESEAFRKMHEFRQSQGGSLYNACIGALTGWEMMPKWTAAEARKTYEAIAARSGDLLKLLAPLYWQDRELQRVDTYMDERVFRGLANAFDLDDREFDPETAADYVHFWVCDALPDVPVLLIKLQELAMERAKNPRCVPQPKSKNAPMAFFIRSLSAYFVARYGWPLHEHVAVLANVVLSLNGSREVDADKVRGLVRTSRSMDRGDPEKTVTN